MDLIRKPDNPHLQDKVVDISKWLHALHRISMRIGREERPYFDRLLGSTIYLFKDSSYSYEEETRIIYSFDAASNQFQHTRQKPPKLFVQPTFPVWIKEIILGPKFGDINTHIPYLQEQIEVMCQRVGTQPPRITLSNIDYR